MAGLLVRCGESKSSLEGGRRVVAACGAALATAAVREHGVLVFVRKSRLDLLG